MVAMSRTPSATEGRAAWDSIFRKLSKKNRESHNKMVKSETFFAIDKQRLLDVLEVYFAQSKGFILTDIRKRIIDLNRSAPAELGECYRTPVCLQRWLLEKHDVLVEDGRGLTSGELIRDFRASNIMCAYQLKGGVI